MTKKKTGRPTKLTTEVVSKLEEALRHGATVTEACFLSGISREMFYHHFRSDQVFSDKMELSRNWLSTIAKQNIARTIKAGDIKSSVWLLEKHDSFEFGTIADEVPVDDKNNDTIERFERLIQYRMDQYKHRLEATYDFVPKNNSRNVA